MDAPQTYCDHLATALVTKFAGWGGIPANATLEWVKVNNIAPNGKYADAVTHSTGVAVTPGAAGNVQKAPSFCSIAVTLETGILRGHAARGRIYLPNYGYAPNGSMIAQADVNNVLAIAKSLLTTLQGPVNAATPEAIPCVVSKLGAGTARVITGVSVDNVYDVQRKRKDRDQRTRTAGPAY